ncbi:MAG: heavy metal translocating P-type ATPase [Caryophanon sp.]|nr:heavy metal translocating P-type ATPase [Caryophanon sp.]
MTTTQQLKKEHVLVTTLKAYGELLLAIIVGVLILFAWRMDIVGLETAAILTYIAAFFLGGYTKAKSGILKGVRERKLNVEILMILAAVGASLTGYWTEGALLIFIFAISGAFETLILRKSQKDLSALIQLQPQEAALVRGGFAPIMIPVKDLTIGDHILVKPGERIPVDGHIFKGYATIDESALSGESMPLHKETGDAVFAGTMNLHNAMTVVVSKKADDTVFQHILTLMERAKNDKAPAQLLLERIEQRYVQVVLIVVGIMMFLPVVLFDWSFETSFYRAMVLLVIASPSALVASIMPATLAAISASAKQGILFKGGSHFDTLSRVRQIVFDKTGTLTMSAPKVVDVVVAKGENKDDTLRLLGAIESKSNHPLAQALVKELSIRYTLTYEALTVEEIAGQGLIAHTTTRSFRVGNEAFVGEHAAEAFLKQHNIDARGKTFVFLEEDGVLLAVASLQDPIRPEATMAISQLKALGIEPVMLTGDNEHAAQSVAEMVGIAHVEANKRPEEKAAYIEAQQHVAMVGDGINDAPALALADVGIAMGKGTAVALETANVALMENDLRKLVQAITLSRKLQRIITQNLAVSVIVIALLIGTNYLQLLNLPFSVLLHELSVLFVILNGLRMLK